MREMMLPRRNIQCWIVIPAAFGLVAGATYLANNYGWRHATLFVIGMALGLVLYHTRFGFTFAFRALITHWHGQGIRAQMLMFALATLLFAPILALNDNIGGAVAPVSLAVLAGAFIFSIGMQIGGG